MFKRIETKKVEKTVQKAIKKVNNFINEKQYLGRYIIRDCFHTIEKDNNEKLILSYCFEYIDKESKKRKFYQTKKDLLYKEVTIELFEKELKQLLKFFADECPIANKKDYRSIKID